VRALFVAILVGLAVPSAAGAAAYFKPLVAGTPGPHGGGRGTSLGLPMRTDEFRVIKRPSRSSLTLGWPKARPCAHVTYKLLFRFATVDPLTVVRADLPNAFDEGTESAGGVLRRAWRIDSSIRNSLLTSSGESVEQLSPSDPFGPIAPAVRTITMKARMEKPGGRCGGTNFFRLGPGVESVIKLG
jgi:hypothetical protein